MKKRFPSTALALALLALGAGLASVLAARAPQETSRTGAAATLGATRTAIELLEAQPFVVDEPFVHEWRAEKPLVRSGTLLVLRVEPELARPRDTYERVLYVGQETAERFNAPEEGGILVVLVPAPLDERGAVALDLDATPIWFGGQELPERVDAARIRAELDAARAAGIGPARRGAHVQPAAREPIAGRTREDLLPYVADWLERYSPAEVDLVRQLRQVGRR